MALMTEQKRQLFNLTTEIVKQAASGGGQNGPMLADMFEKVYEKMKALAEKDEL